MNQIFNCTDCELQFDGAHFNHCMYHSSKPMINFGSNVGFYPCCEKKAYKFDTRIRSNGCISKRHQIQFQNLKHQDESEPMVAQILEKQDMTQEPLKASHVDQEQFSLNEALKTYVLVNKEQLIIVGEDEMEEDDEEESKSKSIDDSFTNNDSKNYHNQSIGSQGKDYGEFDRVSEYSPETTNRNSKVQVGSLTLQNRTNTRQGAVSQNSQSKSKDKLNIQQIQQNPYYQVTRKGQNSPNKMPSNMNTNIKKRDQSGNKGSADSTEVDLIKDFSLSPTKLSPRSVKNKKGIKIDCSNLSKAQVKQIKRDNLRQKDRNNIQALLNSLKKMRVNEQKGGSLSPSQLRGPVNNPNVIRQTQKPGFNIQQIPMSRITFKK